MIYPLNIFRIGGGGGGSELNAQNQDTPLGVVDTINIKGNGVGVKVGSRLDVYVNAAPTAFAVSSFSHDAGANLEIGQSVSNFNLNWAYNQGNANPTSQSINQGVGSVAAGLRTAAIAGPVTANTTYTLSATKGLESDSAQTSVTFGAKRYWGVSPDADLVATGISTHLLLSSLLENFQEEFATTRQTTKSFDCSAGARYVYFLMPASLGTITPEIMSGVFPVVLAYTQTFSFTNFSGHTQSYRIYRSNNPQNSNNVTWSIL